MQVVVNGDPMEVAPKIKVTELLTQLKLKPELVVVELNLNILKREELALTLLKEKDQVEIVRIVGGGAPSRNEDLPDRKRDCPIRMTGRPLFPGALTS